MGEFLAALIGAVIGGSFALLGSFVQARFQGRQLQQTFEHQQRMAEAEYQRERVAIENHEIREQIRKQLTLGEQLRITVGRVSLRFDGVTDGQERRNILAETKREVGMEDDGYFPLASVMEPDLFEDDDLRRLVKAHREAFADAYIALLVSQDRPGIVPEWEGFSVRISELKRTIELRVRELLRKGMPF